MPAIDPGATLPPQRSKIAVPLLLAVVLAAPFLPTLLSGEILGQRSCDGPSQFFLFHHFAARCWLNGEAPLWNPHIMLGLPFLGEGQASIFHPLSALFLVLPDAVAMNLTILLCFLANGLAFYAYLRVLDLTRTVAFLGAIVWSFSCAPIARIYAGHLNMLLELPVLPFVLWCWHRYLRDRRRRDLVLLALGYGSLFLAAYPQWAYTFSLFFVSYAVFHAVFARGATEPVPGVKLIALLGLFMALGVALGAIQLLPSFDFARQSFRSKSSYDFCTFFSLPPESFVTLICPEFYGRTPTPGDAQYWGRTFFWDTWLYIGILPLLAAVAGIFAAPKRIRRTLGVLAILFLVVGLGRNTPLYRLLYNYFPLYDVFRCPAKHCIVTLFALTIFAAYGFQAWLNGLGSIEQSPPAPMRSRAFRATMIFGAVLLAICTVLLFIVRNADAADSAWRRFMAWVYAQKEIHLPPFDDTFPSTAARFTAHQLWRAMILLALSLAAIIVFWRWSRSGAPTARKRIVGLGIIAALLAADFATFTPHFLDTYPEAQTRYSDTFLQALPQTPYPVRYFDDAAHANVAMRYGFSSIGGYMGNTVRRYNRFLNATQGFDPAHSQATATIPTIPPLYLDLLAIDALHVPRSVAPRDLPATPTDAGWMLVDNRGRCPRAFLAASPRACVTEEEAFAYVLHGQDDLRQSPAIETAGPLPTAAPLETTERVEFASFSTNRIDLTVETSRPRVLVLCEMFDKDWTAQVNGKPAAAGPANYLFRSVAVPPGKSQVVFEYRPTGLLAGSLISALAIAVLLVLLVRSPHRP